MKIGGSYLTKVCKYCKTVNPNEAKFCEKCGKKFYDNLTETKSRKKSSNDTNTNGWWNKQSSHSKAAVLLSGIFCVFLIIIIIAASSNSGSGTGSGTDISSPTQNNTTDTHPEAAKVVIINSTANKDSIGNYIITGVVQNKNNFGVAFVKINATGYDKDGNVVNKNIVYADVNDLSRRG